MSVILGFISFIGRLLLVGIFLFSAADFYTHFTDRARLMTQATVPYPEASLWIAIVFLALGSLLVLMGWHARFGAFLLLVFLALVNFYFHNFWDFPKGTEKFTGELAQFLKNAAIIGAFVLIIANGPGRFSIDCMCKAAPKTS